jgi:hypothetical protein
MAVRGVAINNSGLAQNGNIPGPQGSGFLQLNIILTVQNAGTLLAGSRIVLVPITGI